MIIANPIYDAPFKSLLEDITIAEGFLSTILDTEVRDVQLISQEQIHRHPDTQKLTVFRMDFSATIFHASREKWIQTILELQKAKILGDILRFRRYLGKEYTRRVRVTEKGEISLKSVPILPIYIFGFNYNPELPFAIHVDRVYRDCRTGKPVKTICEDWVERLTHDGYFIQLPQLKPPLRNDMEKMLSLFDQAKRIEGDPHRLEGDWEKLRKENPLIDRILNRLQHLGQDPAVDEMMDLEDEWLDEQQAIIDREVAEERTAKEEAIKAREEERAAKEEERAAKEEERAAKEEERAAKEEAIKAKENAVKMLLAAEFSIEEIAGKVGIPVDEVKRLKAQP